MVPHMGVFSCRLSGQVGTWFRGSDQIVELVAGREQITNNFPRGDGVAVPEIRDRGLAVTA